MELEAGVQIPLSEAEIIDRVNWFLKEEKRIRGRYVNMVKEYNFLYLSDPLGSISIHGNTYYDFINKIQRIGISYRGFTINASYRETTVRQMAKGYDTYFTVPNNLFYDTNQNIIGHLVRYYEDSFKKRIELELLYQQDLLDKTNSNIKIINKLKNGEDIK